MNMDAAIVNSAIQPAHQSQIIAFLTNATFPYRLTQANLVTTPDHVEAWISEPRDVNCPMTGPDSVCWQEFSLHVAIKKGWCDIDGYYNVTFEVESRRGEMVVLVHDPSLGITVDQGNLCAKVFAYDISASPTSPCGLRAGQDPEGARLTCLQETAAFIHCAADLFIKKSLDTRRHQG